MRVIVNVVSLVMFMVAVAIIAFIIDGHLKQKLADEVAARLQTNLSEVRALINLQIESFNNDLAFLYATPPISGLARTSKNQGVDPLDGTTTELWESRLEQIFAGYLQNNAGPYQLRVLDKEGREIIRVERKNGKIAVAPPSELQNKRQRYYFKEALKLSQGNTYTSRIDLNKERGMATYPYQPTLRLARPIYSAEGDVFGVLIANIDVSQMLMSLGTTVGGDMVTVITDDEGYFISHPLNSLSYSRDLNPRATLQSTYSEDESEFGNLRAFRFNSTSERFYGLSDDLIIGFAGAPRKIKVSLFVSEASYQGALMKERQTAYLAMASVLALTLVLVFYFFRASRKQQKLAEMREEAQAVVDVSHDGIITVDKENCIVNLNHSAEVFFNCQASDAKGCKVSTIISSDRELETKLASFRKDQSIAPFKVVLPGDSCGKKQRVLCCALSGLTGKCTQSDIALVFSDISAEQEAKQQLEAAKASLEEKVKSRTKELKVAHEKAVQTSELKSQFIANISHEMRTPLNGIVGATSLMKKEKLTPKVRTMLDMTEISVNSLNTLINDILDLSKIEAGKLELNYRDFQPNAWIETLLSTLSVNALEKGLDFYVDTSGLDIRQMHSDSHRLTQIVTNLVNNAIKFTAEGYIQVTARGTYQGGEKYLEIEVSDTGIGVSQEKQRKLFKSFSQADESVSEQYGGSGLGLSICKQLTELLNGQISLTSEEGHGSTFTVVVPATSWSPVSDKNRTRLKQHRILIVSEREPLVTILQNLTHSHGGATQRWDGERSWPANTEKPSVIFIDLKNRHGDALLSQLENFRHEFPECRIVKISKRLTPDAQTEYEIIREPLFRSDFLSTVANERRGGEAPAVANGQRSSDTTDNNKQVTFVNKKGHVLVVDDNSINVQVAGYILEELGVTYESAENGEVALKKLATAESPFHCVLMDCNMPVMSGYKATELIRRGEAGKQNLNIPVIAMTANALKGESDKCLKAGMNDFITKPVDAEMMKKKVAIWIDQADDALSPQGKDQEQAPGEDAVWNKEASLQRLSNNVGLLHKILDMFKTDIDERLKKLRAAIEDEDHESLRQTAHALKGNAGDVGAEALYTVLAELENAARNADTRHYQPLLDKASNAASETLAQIEAYQATA